MGAQMAVLLALSALVGLSQSAPSFTDYSIGRPSPVHPSVIAESRPPDRILIISDPRELAMYMNETHHPFYPTALPEAHTTSTFWAEEKLSNALGSQQLGSKPNQGAPIDSKEQRKRDIPVPLVPKKHHPEVSVDIDSEASDHSSQSVDTSTEMPHEDVSHTKPRNESSGSAKAEPIHANVAAHIVDEDGDNQQALNVPSVSGTNGTNVTAAVPAVHPALRPKPVPVAELFGRQ